MDHDFPVEMRQQPKGWPEEMEVRPGCIPLFTTRTYHFGGGKKHRAMATVDQFSNGRTSVVFRVFERRRGGRFKPTRVAVAFNLDEFRAVCVSLNKLLQERTELADYGGTGDA